MQTDEDPVVERETIYSHLLHCLPPDLYNHNSQRYARRLTIGCYDSDTGKGLELVKFNKGYLAGGEIQHF